MAYEFHYTPTGTGVISGKEVLEQTEDAINDLGNTAISGVQEALDKSEQALTNSENAVDDAQTALNTANNAEGVAIQAQTDVGNLSGTVTNIGNRVTTAEGNITNLQGRMTTAEGNITNLQGRMTTAEGDIGNLQTAVSTAQATANSAQQTATTARQQSYAFRYSSTASTPSSTNANSLLDNTDNLKVGDKVIDSRGVLFSVTAIDTQNSTFTIGTALIDLAQDSDVVHKSGNETVTGIKTITDTNLEFKSTSAEYGVSAGDSSVIFKDKNNLQTFKIYSRVFFSGLDNNLVSFFLTQKVGNTYYISNGIQLFANTGNKNVILRPILANNNADGLFVSLGDSNRKWSDVQTYKINALEPSSLSLPSDRSARIDISSYITNLGNGDTNAYTVPANGYIWLQFTSITSIICYSQTSSTMTNYAQTFTRSQGDGLLYVFFPVRKNDKFIVQIYTSSTAVVQNAYFIPCQGNV